MTDDEVMAVFTKLRDKAERVVEEGGDVSYWLGYVAGITDAILDLTHPLSRPETPRTLPKGYNAPEFDVEDERLQDLDTSWLD